MPTARLEMRPKNAAKDEPSEAQRAPARRGGSVLMVAFHFPPIASSSGFLRTTFFARYLPKSGWTPTVLTVRPEVYERTDEQNLGLVGSTPVIRCRALDTTRDLAWRGKYPLFLALPDRWVSWAVPAVVAGWRAVRRHRLQVIWSTFPIPTAVMIGYLLKKFTGRPWVVDIRDVIVDEEFPETPAERRVYSWLEAKVACHADAVVVTTSGARRMYIERYPELEGRVFCIPNGFDESLFEGLDKDGHGDPPCDRPLTLLHSGLLSRVDRNPLPFFDAVRALTQSRELLRGDAEIVLRASGERDFYQRKLDDRGVADIVKLEPAIGYGEALREMMSADGLLLFQGSTCNHAIPAKLYEYLRSGRPIMAVTDPAGNVAELLQRLRTGVIADCNDAEDIEQKLRQFIDSIRSGSYRKPDSETVQSFSREAQARQLARLLSQLSSRRGLADP